jgi:hypothetical protein
MSYNIAGSLFRTRGQAVKALVEEFLSAGGLNDYDDARDIASPEAAADELLEMWGGNLGANWEDTERDEDGDLIPVFATRDELIDAINDFVARPSV